MAEVIELYQKYPVATCPQCKGQQWFIHVNGSYDDFDKITSHECCGCGWALIIEVEFVKGY